MLVRTSKKKEFVNSNSHIINSETGLSAVFFVIAGAGECRQKGAQNEKKKKKTNQHQQPTMSAEKINKLITQQVA
jgi:hypothetical protein